VTMTHQEILDAFETIYRRSHEVAKAEREWIGAERSRLQSACGEVGHILGRDRSYIAFDLRCCAICGVAAPKDAVEAK
jgi:hypothetical protein